MEKDESRKAILAIQSALEQAFYQDRPEIAAQLEHNRHRRLEEAIAAPVSVLEILGLPVTV